MKKDYNIDKAPKPMGHYPHSKRVGNFLFLSGIGSRKKTDNSIPENFEDECHSVFENIRTVLEESNSKLEDLIDVTIFLTDMNKDFNTFNKLYKDYFKDINPCRTTIEVKSLPTPISIEMKCIAFIGNKY
ncbi:MAG: 2-aminomuconate deaminase [Candidatus Marinimicrobia bacterium]|nr:2-aminomuconate deaminase [Candidatus Neomarinimicrobiota bacterium]|tara:strand:- start:1070 stop:1459 length:390 start_codon:yes stop_codon:yes gene_type:complete